MQAPTWLPFRIRCRWDNARIGWALRGLDRTPPRPASPFANADAEVHMLLCRRDQRIGVLALKSLLRFTDTRFAVTLTNDGSLNQDDCNWIDRHVPGCRWLQRRVEYPRLASFLSDHPRMAKTYQGSYHPICKLLHAALVNRHERVIVYDPDTAFFRRPDRLLQWAKGQDAHAWYLHDHQNEDEQVPNATREAFKELAALCEPAGLKWRMDYYFFNSGLLAFRPAQLNLELAEKYQLWRETASPSYRTGKADLWFGDWTPEQTAYQIMFALMDPPAKPLGDDYHLGGDAGHVFNHFLRHYLVQSQSLQMLQALVNTL
ncbi:MAG TPA: hypothetical protein VE988_09665 [Gemmataceae bacterium]|nr:hypothetical protein [Gemmataceae bacterium]